jgi:CHAD domain-containing protein
VHALRVETRRLLAGLELLEAVHPVPAIAKARRALKQQLAASGPLRDLQVQLRLTRRLPGPGPAWKTIRRQLRRREHRQARILARKLAGAKAKNRLAVLKAALRAWPGAGSADQTVRVRLQRLLARKFDRMVRLQRRALDGAEQLHRARIALKKLRYLAGKLQPLPDRAGAAALGRLRRCQDLMGEIHDLDLLLVRIKAEHPTSGKRAAALCAATRRQRDAAERSYRAAQKHFRERRVRDGLRRALANPGSGDGRRRGW